MKIKYSFIFLFYFGFSVNIFGQSILAGIHGVSDYFYDNNPDKIIYAPIKTFPNYNVDTFLIDVNNDNINDFKISTISDNGGNWYSYINCTIEPLNNNQISIDSFDSCFANCPADSIIYELPIVKVYSMNDSINDNSIWINSIAYLSFARWSANIPNSCGYNCDGTISLPSSRYLGVKVFALTDTLFGWIKIKDVATNSLTVEEFACNLHSTSIENIHRSSAMFIYPNPTSGKFSIKNSFLSTSNCNLRIYDLLGNIFYDEIINPGISEITLSTIPKGIYLLKLTSETESLITKIIIE